MVTFIRSNIVLAQKFCLEPKVSLQSEVQNYLDVKIRYFDMLGKRLLFVFDNARNLLKQETNKLRANNTFEARQELESLWLDEGKTIDDISNEHYKRCTFIRDDIIQCACDYLIEREQGVMFSPSEADTQLVAAQKAGIGDAILTSDSDILGLGGNFVIYDLNFSNGKCFIL
jgi:5'-3' exonuclease